MEGKVKICPNCSEIMERRSDYFYTCDKCMSYHNTAAFPQTFGISPLSMDGPKLINHGCYNPEEMGINTGMVELLFHPEIDDNDELYDKDRR